MSSESNRSTPKKSQSAEGDRACPFLHGSHTTIAEKGTANRDWWPNQLNLNVLRQNDVKSAPYDRDFSYSRAFESLDYQALKEDLTKLMTDSQDWWPADYGHYGPLFIRMAWHSAGTYRIEDGRGGASSGTQRFAPLNSWPDNANLDKARRLLWPIKQKYGAQISWADLMILAGNCALESMGFKTLGFAGGREDVWHPEYEINWGIESAWLDDKRYQEDRELDAPYAAVQMGLIYVNPEGPNGEPEPEKSAIDIRETFRRMAMDDFETVALIAGGHTFGKSHGAGAESHMGPEPEAAAIEEMGLGWTNRLGKGNGQDTITSGIEGTWTAHPTVWDSGYFDTLFKYEWELVKSPAGAWQWHPKEPMTEDLAPAAHGESGPVNTMMTTADLALIHDPAYREIATMFHKDPALFANEFAKAWFKLTHRDMGPLSRYLGPEVPDSRFVWQDPVPANGGVLSADSIATLKNAIRDSGLPSSEMIFAAWASASSYRDSDKRGGANGARIRMAPQKDWPENRPEQLHDTLCALKKIQLSFNQKLDGDKQVSLADLIVLAGNVAIEDAAEKANVTVHLPFNPGRTDASVEETDSESFAVLRAKADAFRNYYDASHSALPEELMLDKALQLNLSPVEMTVLLGGLRTLNINSDSSSLGILTDKPGVLSNDFFKNILDMNLRWEASPQVSKHANGIANQFVGIDRISGEHKWQATRVDLIFGSHSELRALAEVYASDDAFEKFVADFAKTWTKVMEADRFDLKK